MRPRLLLPCLALLSASVLGSKVAWADDDGAWFGDDADEAAPAQKPAPSPPPAEPEPSAAPANDAAAPPEPSAKKPSAQAAKPSHRRAPSDSDSWGPPTLLGHRGKLAFGGYGGVTALGTKLTGVYGALIGGEAAFLLDHRLAIGVGGMGLASDIQGPPDTDGTRSRLELGYGGVLLEANLVGSSPVYLSVGGLLGAGGIAFCAYGPHRYEVQCNRDRLDESVFFVAEPRIGLHANVTRWLRLGVEARYRFTQGVDSRGLRDSDVSGASAGGSIQFGWF